MSRESFPMYCYHNRKFGDKASTPLSLSSLDVQTVINGLLPTVAITTTIMTFRNTHGRVLEGALEFTLPENAVICAYGLDIDGHIEDGVVVEKEKARIAFEEAVRSGESAGLSEMAQGNVFKTRVYPIPANGTRQVKVAYQHEASIGDGGDVVFNIPIHFDEKLDSLRIAVECSGGEGFSAPKVLKDVKGDTGKGLEWTEDGDKWVAVHQWKSGVSPGEDDDFNISVSLPRAAASPLIALELDPEDAKQAYFAISCIPRSHASSEGELDEKDRAINHVSVYWDSSLNRDPVQPGQEKARTLEIEFLAALIANLRSKISKDKKLTLSFSQFREVTEPHNLFSFSGQADDEPGTKDTGELKLFREYVGKIAYDGGTNLGDLRFKRDLSPLTKAPVDVYLVFSDGLVSIGQEQPGDAEAPVFTFNGAERSNAPLLKFVAQVTGGLFFNAEALSRAEEVAASIAKPQFQFLSHHVTKGAANEVYPNNSVALETKSTRFTLVGKISSDTTVTLKYGQNRFPSHEHSFDLKMKAAVRPTGILRRLWAQNKMATLESFPERNKAELEEIGKKFGIVTSGASFVVLDNVDQYLKHNIQPPQSRQKIFLAYQAKVKETTDTENARVKSKLSVVKDYWSGRKAWHARDFSHATRSVSPTKGFFGRPGGGGGRGGPPPPAGRGPPGGVMPSPARGAPAPAPASDLLSSIRSSGARLGGVPTPTTTTTATESNRRSQSPASPARQAVPLSRSLASADKKKSAESPRERMSAPLAKRGGASPSPSPSRSSSMMPGSPSLSSSSSSSISSGLSAGDSDGGWGDETKGGSGGSIKVQKWDPSTPYIAKLKKSADPAKCYEAYLKERKAYLASPSFYFDCASFFFTLDSKKQTNVHSEADKFGRRVLTSVLELELDSPQLLRIVGYKLAELGDGALSASIFERVLTMRPDEPQSHRDLALVLSENNLQFERAITLFNKVILGKWDTRFQEIELTALMEMNSMLSSSWGKAKYATWKKNREDLKLDPVPDPSLVDALPVDLRIVMGWDTDMTDVDLHVIDPTGEECMYSHRETRSGGLMSRDFTQGYGPEEFSIKVAPKGKYRVRAKYFASHQQSLTGATTLLLYIYRFFGSEHQEKETITLRLATNKEMIDVATVEFADVPTLATLDKSASIADFAKLIVKGTPEKADVVKAAFTHKDVGVKTVGDLLGLQESDLEEVAIPASIKAKVVSFLNSRK